MASTWSLCVILFAAVFSARAYPLEDEPLIEKVQKIVSNIDNYLATHGMNELILPDIGIFSFEPVKLRNGGVGEFSTIYVQDASSVNKSKVEDGTLYSFDINLGLEELLIHYNFDISAIILKEKGNFSLSVLDNSAKVTGFVTIQSNKVCKAKLVSVQVLKLENYRIELPEDMTDEILISEMILNTISPALAPFLNKVLNAALFIPGIQNVFSAIACSQLSELV